MGWLDKGVEQKDFDEFKAEINQRLLELTEEVRRTITEDEAAAHQSALNASAAEQRIQSAESVVSSAISDLEEYRNQALLELQKLQEKISSNSEANQTLAASIEKNNQLSADLLTEKTKIDEFVVGIKHTHEQITEALSEANTLPESVAETREIVEAARKLSDDLQNLLNHSIKRKADIDDLHKDIYGYEIKNSDGVPERVDGLKDELEKSYGEVSNQTEKLAERLDEVTREIAGKHKKQLSEELTKFEKLVTDSSEKVATVSDQLKALMPGAMAAGLSAAYEAKKTEEETALKGYELGFRWAIGGLVLVSLIPLAVDVYLLNWKGVDLVKVLQDTPNLIISIFPLYFPVLWLAYSTNKKLNLSKRLIEEYTHKAVLGKTFSGLSNQIDNLPEENLVKDELRTRLLFNILQVSAENPGKLITNYQKSDHPLMEALENSAKLSDSFDALSKIPGLSSVFKKLSAKSDELLREQEKKVSGGLAAQDTLESNLKP
jgi:uncharacterized coiled-coil DUF342 family protein